METKEKRTKVVASVLALASLLLIWTLATAGDLEPSAPPGPTMKTLDEVYEAVVSGSSGISEREGYMQYYLVAQDTSETFFTVPAGKRFVLLKLFFTVSYDTLYLTVNDNLFISAVYFPFDEGNSHVEDFPDRCVVVNAGKTLKVVNEGNGSRRVTIIGYFYDI